MLTPLSLSNKVLNAGSGIGEVGSVQMGLAIGLVISWVAVFISVFKGVQSSGKVRTCQPLLPVPFPRE